MWDKFKIRNKVKIVTPDHKNSHKGQFFLHLDLNIIKAELISFPLMYGLLGYNIWLRDNYLKNEIWGCKKNLNIDYNRF